MGQIMTRELGNSWENQPVQELAASVYDGETRRKYRINLSQFFLWMDRYRHYTPILAAEPKHIKAYEVYLKSRHWDQHPGDCVMECDPGVLPYADSSIAVKRSAIASFFSYCVEQPGCAVSSNPVTRRRGRLATGDDAKESLKDILMPDEIMQMRSVALSATSGRGVLKMPTLRSAVVSGIFVGAGLRCEELEKARVEKLGWRGKSPTLRFKRKNGRWQTIDLGYQLGPLIWEYIGDRKSGPIVITDSRRRRNPETGDLEHAGVSSDTLRDILTELSHASGIRPGTLHPHLLRHTSITLALTHPHAKPQNVMIYYGHRDFDTTMRYFNHTALLAPGWHRNFYGVDWETQAFGLAS
jgi:site-specific recombinase XerD